MKRLKEHYDHIYYINNIDNENKLIYHLDENYESYDDYPDENGKTAFHHAMYYCSIRIIKFLIEKKNVDVNLTDDSGNIPLHYCIFRDDYQEIEYFIKIGAKIKKICLMKLLTH